MSEKFLKKASSLHIQRNSSKPQPQTESTDSNSSNNNNNNNANANKAAIRKFIKKQSQLPKQWKYQASEYDKICNIGWGMFCSACLTSGAGVIIRDKGLENMAKDIIRCTCNTIERCGLFLFIFISFFMIFCFPVDYITFSFVSVCNLIFLLVNCIENVANFNNEHLKSDSLDQFLHRLIKYRDASSICRRFFAISVIENNTMQNMTLLIYQLIVGVITFHMSPTDWMVVYIWLYFCQSLIATTKLHESKLQNHIYLTQLLSILHYFFVFNFTFGSYLFPMYLVCLFVHALNDVPPSDKCLLLPIFECGLLSIAIISTFQWDYFIWMKLQNWVLFQLCFMWTLPLLMLLKAQKLALNFDVFKCKWLLITYGVFALALYSFSHIYVNYLVLLCAILIILRVIPEVSYHCVN